jgi:integrase
MALCPLFEFSIDTGLRPSEARDLHKKTLREDPDLGWIIDLRRTKTMVSRTIH